MRRFLRFLLPWLIAVALPVQGVAAATVALCGPIHQHTSGSSKAHDAAPTALTHDRHAEHHHDSVQAKQDLPAKTSCSACAACCTGTAISTADYVLPDFAAVDRGPVPAKISFFVGFIPDLPEHPPRHILV
ncbi:MAG TPA: hypothetical protein VJS66_04450 [Burkholderiales bacterium]|nr:hypothetical protein [Burkholderiales bacterium]